MHNTFSVDKTMHARLEIPSNVHIIKMVCKTRHSVATTIYVFTI